jgi:hypothetical protein
MKFDATFRKAALTMVAAALGCMAANAQAPAAEGVPVDITVTATSKGELPNLSTKDFLVHQGHERRAVLNAVRQQGANDNLDLVILMDDASESGVGSQFSDVGGFVRTLPPSVRVGVAYARNGMASLAQNLTSDHDAALKALRLPLGRAEGTSGLYFAVEDLAKKLPPAEGRRRAIFLVSSGIDLFRGAADTAPGLNPDLQTAIDSAQRSGITVYAIYASAGGHFLRNFYLVTNGQSCLSRLAFETGGEAYFQGFDTPVSFRPFLEDMRKHLGEQYIVTFSAKPGKKSRLEGIRVTTELSGVELIAPSAVYVPEPK